jgi:thiosulfate reductase cytochrome b subunit
MSKLSDVFYLCLLGIFIVSLVLSGAAILDPVIAKWIVGFIGGWCTGTLGRRAMCNLIDRG